MLALWLGVIVLLLYQEKLLALAVALHITESPGALDPKKTLKIERYL